MRSSAALILLATSALAHGPSSQTLGVAQSPWSATGLVANTNFGLLVTENRCTWQWVCPDHLGLGPREVPTWTVLPSGTITAAALSGLYLSRDRGCTFEKHPFFDATGAADVVTSGADVFVTTSKFGVLNGLARSTDDARTFTWTAIREDRAFFTAVRVAPSRPQRLYVSSWYVEQRPPRLWASDDRGDTFTSVELPPSLAVGTAFTVHAVSKADPDLLFASMTDDAVTPERATLLRSRDGGRTFEVALQAEGRVTSVAEDGGRWWVAVGERVYEAEGQGAFTVLPKPTQKACVARVAGETLVCGRQFGADAFALATLKGEEAVPLLTWRQLEGPVACPMGTPGSAACKGQWPVERAELGLPTDHVASCGPATPGPTHPPALPKGCSAAPGSLLLGALAWRRRR